MTKLIKNIIQEINKPEPWRDLEKNWVLTLNCEKCSVELKTLFSVEGLFYCAECADAQINIDRLQDTDAEFDEHERLHNLSILTKS